MKTRALIWTAALALTALTACGGDETTQTTEPPFTLSAGTFTVSNVQATDGDSCQIAPWYQGGTLTVTQDGKVVSFQLPNVAHSNNDSENTAQATLDGNALVSPVPADADSNKFPDGCQLFVEQTLSGNLTANDTLALGLTVTISDESHTPGSCTAEDAQTDQMPCTSTLTFTATRAP